MDNKKPTTRCMFCGSDTHPYKHSVTCSNCDTLVNDVLFTTDDTTRMLSLRVLYVKMREMMEQRAKQISQI